MNKTNLKSKFYKNIIIVYKKYRYNIILRAEEPERIKILFE